MKVQGALLSLHRRNGRAAGLCWADRIQWVHAARQARAAQQPAQPPPPSAEYPRVTHTMPSSVTISYTCRPCPLRVSAHPVVE